jgi:plastocyanin
MQSSAIARTARKLLLPAVIAMCLGLLAGVFLHNHLVVAQHSHASARPGPARPVIAAGDVVVEVSGFAFSPTVVIIEPGQTVTWIRRNGFHNVAADDGSYRSGDADDTWDTYSHTFVAAGESLYHCELHGAAGGIGMAGKIIVQVSGQSAHNLYLPLMSP